MAIQLAALLPPARWSKRRSVSRPTLNLSQVRIALASVCLISTWVRPPDENCVGRLAPCHRPTPPSVLPGTAPGATTRPPGASPFGTLLPAAKAAARAAAWMLRMPCIDPAARIIACDAVAAACAALACADAAAEAAALVAGAFPCRPRACAPTDDIAKASATMLVLANSRRCARCDRFEPEV